jgi:hypothetical protein
MNVPPYDDVVANGDGRYNSSTAAKTRRGDLDYIDQKSLIDTNSAKFTPSAHHSINGSKKRKVTSSTVQLTKLGDDDLDSKQQSKQVAQDNDLKYGKDVVQRRQSIIEETVEPTEKSDHRQGGKYCSSSPTTMNTSSPDGGKEDVTKKAKANWRKPQVCGQELYVFQNLTGSN